MSGKIDMNKKIYNGDVRLICPACNYTTRDAYRGTKGQYCACPRCGRPMRLEAKMDDPTKMDDITKIQLDDLEI